jgi:signal transduction histidine kinase/ActR/RegA family two-component response regulator
MIEPSALMKNPRSQLQSSQEPKKAEKGSPVIGIAILIAAAAGLGAVAWLARGRAALEVPSETVRFANPRSMHADAAGNIVVVDSGERRILGLAPDGTLRFAINGERRKGGFYSGRVAGFDSLGRFYVDDTVLDAASSNAAARRFLRYDGTGRFRGAVESWEYAGDAMGDWEHQPIFAQVRDDALYWFLLEKDGVWSIGSKPLLSDSSETSVRLEGVNVYDFIDAVAVSPREAYLLSPDGTIAFARAGEPLRNIFPIGDAQGLLFPTALAMDPEGRLLAADGKRSVIRIDPGSKPVTVNVVLDPEGAKLAFMDLSSDGEGTIRVANEYSGELVSFTPGGRAAVLASARLSPLSLAGTWAAFAAAWAAIAALAAAVILLYYRAFRYRASLVIKQLAVFVPLIAVMTVAVAALVFRTTAAPLEASIEQRLRHLAQIGASELDPADVDALRFEGMSLSQIKGSPAYARVIRVVNRLVNENKDPWNSGVFDYLYRKDGGVWWVVGSFDYIELYPYVKAEFERVIATGEPAYLRYDDIYGSWLSAFAPVLGADGRPAAVLEATMSADVLDETSRAFVRRAAAGGFVILGGFLAAFSVFAAMLLRSIRSMKAGAGRIARGDYEADIEIRSRDEMQDLSDAFNAMSKEIRQALAERKRAAEERARLEVQLLQAQKMESIGRLAGGVAHDFNNMLGVILGFADLALKQVSPAQPLHADLEEIRKAAVRSADLTRQLLAFARKQTIMPKVLDLNETVEGMIKMLHRLVGEEIRLAWLPGRDVWPVKVDPSQIDQILANLCVNARDAISGAGTLTIETGTTSLDAAYCAAHPGFKPGAYVILAVSDNGSGMDESTRSQIFEPFFTTKPVGQGTGLGLATVYGIVKQNHGFINVYSEPGQGTSFKIYLPPHTGAPGQVRTKIQLTPAARGNETILLVEDDAPILEMTARMLETHGYTVMAASTPTAAISLAGAHHGEIHLLLTDVVMPGMNGRDLARNLLAVRPRLRQLFMSGYTSNVIAHHGVLEDGVAFIQKPFSSEALAAKVREALDRPLGGASM